MTRKKLLSLILLLFFVPSFLSGCWDRKELDDQAFVLAMGIDKGKDNMLQVSFRIAIPSKSGLAQAGGGGGSEGSIAERSSLLTSIAAPTIPAAITLASGYINRELNLMHLKAVVFGEPFARDGVGRVLSFLSRNREIRRIIFVGVSKGEAYKMLSSNNPDLEKTFSKWWEGVKMMQKSQAINSGTLFHQFTQDVFNNDINSTMMYLAVNKEAGKEISGDLKIPKEFKQGNLSVTSGEIPRKGGNQVEYVGTAVFKGDKLTDILNITETRTVMMLKGEFQKGYYILPDPEIKNKYISLELTEGSPPITKVSLKNGAITIDETISLEGDLIDIQGSVDYAANNNTLQKLNRYIANYIRENSLAFFEKTKKQEIDIVGYGEYARRDFLTLNDWENFKWHNKLPEAQLNLKVKVNIRRTGMLGIQRFQQTTD